MMMMMPPRTTDDDVDSCERQSHQTSSASIVGPEELVRRENQILRVLRTLLFILLIVVGSLLAFGVYRVTSNAENQKYESDFDAFAKRVTVDFLLVINQAMWNGYSVGVTITASSNLVSGTPNITVPLFEKLAFGNGLISGASLTYWSPLLRGSEERKSWEEYARQQQNTSISVEVPQCWVCGSPDLDVGAPDNIVFGPIKVASCADYSFFGESGRIRPENCPLLLQPEVQKVCQCGPRKGNVTVDRPRSDQVYRLDGNGTVTPVPTSQNLSLPIWQADPPTVSNATVMYDLYSDPVFARAIDSMLSTKQPIFSELVDGHSPNLWNDLLGFGNSGGRSLMFSPVFSGERNSEIIGSIILDYLWQDVIGSLVPQGSDGMIVVLENSCGQQLTFKSTGYFASPVGVGDLHDPYFSSRMQQSSYSDFFVTQSVASPFAYGLNVNADNCAYRVSVYPSADFKSRYITKKPAYYAVAVIVMFVFMGSVFVIYNCYVTWRQQKVMRAALQTDEIVSALFPPAFRGRLFGIGHANRNEQCKHFFHVANPKAQLRSMLSARNSRGLVITTSPGYDPIADFFPSASVVFADISGFTAWSSEHEPSQVFQLLETMYQEFDKIAKRHGVFKIETIGDCYVAAAGVPRSQPDHALRTVKFAYDCILHMHKLLLELEASTGPSTLSLSIRVGINSGPVTAGVLRGDKARFQLFGDTVNIASRLQTLGEAGRIQVSQATAEMLRAAGKSQWLIPRENCISIKGKGFVQTYWVDSADDSTVLTPQTGEANWADMRLPQALSSKPSKEDKMKRLVEWNTDLLLDLLKRVVARRNVRKPFIISKKTQQTIFDDVGSTKRTPFEDLTEILQMDDAPSKDGDKCSASTVILQDKVRSQLLEYVGMIASLYHDNPFHNFEHASHVAMSASKIVKRIIKPEGVDYSVVATTKGRRALQNEIHNGTFGISSDVLMQFAVVFSAVIHDVDHAGVTNAQLVKEGHDLAIRYSDKCVAEQNSIDIAWKLLMEDRFKDLVQCICPSRTEQARFRQLLINAVIATDIADKELQQKRKIRWNMAFHCDNCTELTMSDQGVDGKEDMDRKATIVFEYIIQASDVAHTMQHWKVYNEWNERLFEERYVAYLAGREEKDPSIGWYNGEIWFFDNYIIPLAKKLETCGVFGVSSDEYLSYALENRREWERKGKGIVDQMVAKYSPTCQLELKEPMTVAALEA